MSPQKFRGQVTRFAARFPQIVLMAEKMIWEDDQPDAGVTILSTVATPAAYAALRRFGSSQAGEDGVRMRALFSLMQAGEISQDETLRVWSEGEWRDVQLRQYEISAEAKTLYAPKVADLLERGLQAFQQDDLEQAECLFRRALTLDPRAKEACNNLGTIYARRGEHGRAREMYQEAIKIDPTYVFPRCNLAVYLLDEDDVEGAEVMLSPLVDVTRLHPQEMAFYSYTQARVLMHKKEYDAARKALQMALQIWPGYEPAESLLEHLETFTYVWSGFDSFFERQRKRDQAKRARLQTKLSTAAPSLSEALSLYTKNALTGMGRVILPWGGWSGLRKAELFQRIIEGLQDADNVERMVIDLHDQELAALRQVLAQGGYMSWQNFDAQYGNDLEESSYWEYHEPETVMGRLRLHGFLVEATVDGGLLVVVPTELRQVLKEMLGR
jgi:Tfp pilus assembly protein PilF